MSERTFYIDKDLEAQLVEARKDPNSFLNKLIPHERFLVEENAKSKLPVGRILFAAAGVGVAAYLGYSYLEGKVAKVEPITPAPTPEVNNHILNVAPSVTPNPLVIPATQTLEAPTSSVEEQTQILKRYEFGDVKLYDTFTFIPGQKLGVLSGLGVNGGGFKANKSLPDVHEFWPPEIVKEMLDAGTGKKDEQPEVIIATDVDNLTIVESHSVDLKSAGEGVREIAVNYKKGMDPTGMDLQLKFDHGRTITGTVLGLTIMNGDVFEYGTETKSHLNAKGERVVEVLNNSGTWAQGGGVIYARTDRMGWPQRARENNPNEFVVAFVTCISPNGDVVYKGFTVDSKGNLIGIGDDYWNTFNRVVLFVSFPKTTTPVEINGAFYNQATLTPTP